MFESNTLAQLTEVECLYDFSFNSFCPYYSALYSFISIVFLLVFLWLLLSEEVLVGLDDAHEVAVEGEENGGLEENFEEIVLLLELLVLVLGNSISDEDIISLVDGNVVDHVPGGDAADGDHGEDDGGGELSSAGQGVLDEPVHVEC